MTDSTLELDLHNPQQWAVVLEARLQPFVKSWLTAGKKLTLTCKLQKRSSKQNRRYWSGGVLAQIAAQAVSGGKLHSTENWHEVFKRMFLGVVELPNGQVIGKSSTGLTTAEFCEFSDKVEAYAATELSVIFIDLPVKDLR